MQPPNSYNQHFEKFYNEFVEHQEQFKQYKQSVDKQLNEIDEKIKSFQSKIGYSGSDKNIGMRKIIECQIEDVQSFFYKVKIVSLAIFTAIFIALGSLLILNYS